MSSTAVRRRELELATANVGRLLIGQSLPLAAALVLMALSWIAEAYFVAQLGREELVAVGFAWPIVGFCVSGASGFSRGIGVLISQALGRGDRPAAARHASSLLLLIGCGGAVAVAVFAACHRRLFSALGAPPESLALISQYTVPFVTAACFITAAFCGSAALRGTGDARGPAIVLVLGSLLHVALDPLLIFGVGSLPGFGLIGAGIAAGSAYAIATLVAVFLLREKHMLTFALGSLRTLWSSWLELLEISVVTTFTNLLFPIATLIVTALVAVHGAESVAGYAVGNRVHRVIGVVAISLGAAVIPLVGYNAASGSLERVRETVHRASGYALVWGLASWTVLAAFAGPLADVFCDTAGARSALVAFLQIASLGAAADCALGVTTSAMLALGELRASLSISFLSTVGLAVPCAALGSAWGGTIGILAGLAVASVVACVLGWIWLARLLAALGASTRPAPGIHAHESQSQ